jgi:hypothetical protein
MFVPFIQLSDAARIWIYQADRFIEPEQRRILEDELLAFTSTWMAHGHPLESSFAIFEDHFIVLGVNEQMNEVSGCSIDQSTQAIRHLQQRTGIDFLNRTLVPFEIAGKVKQFPTQELRQKFATGELNRDSVTFNILENNLGALRHCWRIPAYKSWLKRYIGPKAFDSING